jgi:hypothetical protein
MFITAIYMFWHYASSLVQQHSFNPTSDNSETLTMRHLTKVAKTGSFAFYQGEKSINETGKFQGHVQKASKSVCTSTVVVPPDTLSPTP